MKKRCRNSTFTFGSKKVSSLLLFNTYQLVMWKYNCEPLCPKHAKHSGIDLHWSNKQTVYCQSRQLVIIHRKKKKKKRRPQRSCIINTNLDTMIRLIYMISILIIIYMYTSYIYIHMPMGKNRLLLISIGVWIQQSQGWHDRVPVTLSTARNRA